jgi:hypothetical protein
VEKEFSIEIPDKEADAIHSGMSSQMHASEGGMKLTVPVGQAVDYIMKQPDGMPSIQWNFRVCTDLYTAH